MLADLGMPVAPSPLTGTTGRAVSYQLPRH
jgi:hypothetical protein